MIKRGITGRPDKRRTSHFKRFVTKFQRRRRFEWSLLLQCNTSPDLARLTRGSGRRREKFVKLSQVLKWNITKAQTRHGRSGYLMQSRQSVHIGVIDIGSLSQELRHLLLVPSGTGGHEHGALGEAHSASSVSGSGVLAPRLRPGPIRLRALPSLELILAPLLRSFGPGTVCGRHLPPSVSHGEFLLIRQGMSDSLLWRFGRTDSQSARERLLKNENKFEWFPLRIPSTVYY